jgi:hypothetical protein
MKKSLVAFAFAAGLWFSASAVQANPGCANCNGGHFCVPMEIQYQNCTMGPNYCVAGGPRCFARSPRTPKVQYVPLASKSKPQVAQPGTSARRMS